MADPPVAIVEKIVDIANLIKDTVETVRENEEECHGIQKLVCRVSDLLSLLKKSEMMKHREVGGHLEHLRDAASRARDAVTACRQGKKIVLCPCFNFKSRKMSQKLSQVKSDISQQTMQAIFATHAAAVFVATQGQQSALNFDVLFPYTHQKISPLSEPRQSSSPRAVTEELPALAPITRDDVPNNLERPSDLCKSSLPHSHSYTNVDNNESNHLSHRRPKQPRPPPPPYNKTRYIPPPLSPPPTLPTSPLSPPTYVTSPVSKHQTHHPPTRSPLPSPSPAPSNNPVIASRDAQKLGSLPRPSARLPPASPSQSTIEVPLPVPTRLQQKMLGQADGQSTLLPGLREFSLSELGDATQNFSEKNKIGSSDFGIFYKGVLREGLEVAIKEFQDPPQFLQGRLSSKLRLASKLQSKDVEASGNKYIIRVIGYCHKLRWPTDAPHIFLVEEYLPNGNMYSICGQLPWTSRFMIIQGLAQGLQYLHEDKIVHMNVKPANVLLDSHMNPKITDFGIARQLKGAIIQGCTDFGTARLFKGPVIPDNDIDFEIPRLLEGPIIQDNNIAGTVGYMPPEYILEGTLSTMYDVYSFGVTLLETISSMCKTDPARHHASIPWAWNVRECEQMGELFVSSLFEESQLTEVKRCLEIGLLCTQHERTKWPTMAYVLDMLHGKKELGTPRQPEYTKGRVI